MSGEDKARARVQWPIGQGSALSAIRRTREAQSISQERLALIAEVDRSYVGRVERGDNAVAVLTLIRLASAMGITASTLMERAGL